MDYKTADRLIELRKKNGFSQEELADLLNISRQAVSKWERAESLPDTENLIALSKLYKITLDEIVNGEKANTVNTVESHTHIVIPFDRKKSLNIVSFVILGFSILFISIGVGFFLGFTVPENRDLRIAQNEHIEPMNAEVKRIERTTVSIGNETMFKIVFEWSNELSNGSGKSNAVYSKDEAEAMVGKIVSIRVVDNRGVMVDYTRSALSTIGFAFLGAFGGCGIIFIGAFALMRIYNKKEIVGSK